MAVFGLPGTPLDTLKQNILSRYSSYYGSRAGFIDNLSELQSTVIDESASARAAMQIMGGNSPLAASPSMGIREIVRQISHTDRDTLRSMEGFRQLVPFLPSNVTGTSPAAQSTVNLIRSLSSPGMAGDVLKVSYNPQLEAIEASVGGSSPLHFPVQFGTSFRGEAKPLEVGGLEFKPGVFGNVAYTNQRRGAFGVMLIKGQDIKAVSAADFAQMQAKRSVSEMGLVSSTPQQKLQTYHKTYVETMNDLALGTKYEHYAKGNFLKAQIWDDEVGGYVSLQSKLGGIYPIRSGNPSGFENALTTGYVNPLTQYEGREIAPGVRVSTAMVKPELALEGVFSISNPIQYAGSEYLNLSTRYTYYQAFSHSPFTEKSVQTLQTFLGAGSIQPAFMSPHQRGMQAYAEHNRRLNTGQQIDNLRAIAQAHAELKQKASEATAKFRPLYEQSIKVLEKQFPALATGKLNAAVLNNAAKMAEGNRIYSMALPVGYMTGGLQAAGTGFVFRRSMGASLGTMSSEGDVYEAFNPQTKYTVGDILQRDISPEVGAKESGLKKILSRILNLGGTVERMRGQPVMIGSSKLTPHLSTFVDVKHGLSHVLNSQYKGFHKDFGMSFRAEVATMMEAVEGSFTHTQISQAQVLKNKGIRATLRGSQTTYQSIEESRKRAYSIMAEELGFSGYTEAFGRPQFERSTADLTRRFNSVAEFEDALKRTRARIDDIVGDAGGFNRESFDLGLESKTKYVGYATPTERAAIVQSLEEKSFGSGQLDTLDRFLRRHSMAIADLVETRGRRWMRTKTVVERLINDFTGRNTAVEIESELPGVRGTATDLSVAAGRGMPISEELIRFLRGKGGDAQKLADYYLGVKRSSPLGSILSRLGQFQALEGGGYSVGKGDAQTIENFLAKYKPDTKAYTSRQWSDGMGIEPRIGQSGKGYAVGNIKGTVFDPRHPMSKGGVLELPEKLQRTIASPEGAPRKVTHLSFLPWEIITPTVGSQPDRAYAGAVEDVYDLLRAYHTDSSIADLPSFKEAWQAALDNKTTAHNNLLGGMLDDYRSGRSTRLSDSIYIQVRAGHDALAQQALSEAYKSKYGVGLPVAYESLRQNEMRISAATYLDVRGTSKHKNYFQTLQKLSESSTSGVFKEGNRFYTYGTVKADPTQGPSNIIHAKLFIDTENMFTGVESAHSTWVKALRDADNDHVYLHFASNRTTFKYMKRLFKQQSEQESRFTPLPDIGRLFGLGPSGQDAYGTVKTIFGLTDEMLQETKDVLSVLYADNKDPIAVQNVLTKYYNEKLTLKAFTGPIHTLTSAWSAQVVQTALNAPEVRREIVEAVLNGAGISAAHQVSVIVKGGAANPYFFKAMFDLFENPGLEASQAGVKNAILDLVAESGGGIGQGSGSVLASLHKLYTGSDDAWKQFRAAVADGKTPTDASKEAFDHLTEMVDLLKRAAIDASKYTGDIAKTYKTSAERVVGQYLDTVARSSLTPEQRVATAKLMQSNLDELHVVLGKMKRGEPLEKASFQFIADMFADPEDLKRMSQLEQQAAAHLEQTFAKPVVPGRRPVDEVLRNVPDSRGFLDHMLQWFQNPEVPDYKKALGTISVGLATIGTAATVLRQVFPSDITPDRPPPYRPHLMVQPPQGISDSSWLQAYMQTDHGGRMPFASPDLHGGANVPSPEIMAGPAMPDVDAQPMVGGGNYGAPPLASAAGTQSSRRHSGPSVHPVPSQRSVRMETPMEIPAFAQGSDDVTLVSTATPTKELVRDIGIKASYIVEGGPALQSRLNNRLGYGSKREFSDRVRGAV